MSGMEHHHRPLNVYEAMRIFTTSGVYVALLMGRCRCGEFMFGLTSLESRYMKKSDRFADDESVEPLPWSLFRILAAPLMQHPNQLNGPGADQKARR